MDARHLEMTVLMTPDMANFSGKVHGGALLNLLDRVAFSCASRFSEQYAVTLSVDQVTFKEPINVGELVTFRAQSTMPAGRPWRSASGSRRRTSAPARGGTPTPAISPWSRWTVRAPGRSAGAPQTALDKRRHRAAELRRSLRREFAERLERGAGGADDERLFLDGVVPVIDPTAFVHPRHA